MSYLAQTQLETDSNFLARTRAVVTQQSLIFRDDQRPDMSALASALLRNETDPNMSIGRMLASGPGFADAVDNGDGTIDDSKVADAELLAATQSFYPSVASLFFNSDGDRLPGTGGPT